ncbi:starch synthase, partial [Anaerobutyricum soehngenii]|nr:starch synthase [Anaerobutyricum soehngenii]
EKGGLKHTVVPLNEVEDNGDGVSFIKYNGGALINTVNYSKYIYFEQPELWKHMGARAMEKDLSWGVSKKRYEELYNTLSGR